MVFFNEHDIDINNKIQFSYFVQSSFLLEPIGLDNKNKKSNMY